MAKPFKPVLAGQIRVHRKKSSDTDQHLSKMTRMKGIAANFHLDSWQKELLLVENWTEILNISEEIFKWKTTTTTTKQDRQGSFL